MGGVVLGILVWQEGGEYGVAQLVIVEARAADLGFLAGRLGVGVGELLADAVEHEDPGR